MDNKRLIVIGGGAAGFFCAVNAARLNSSLEVILLEKTNKLLSKVKISGGGRCNVTHACFSIPEMTRNYPRGANFLKKAFHRFFTTNTIQWFEERGVKLKKEADGRMFPVTDSSQTIIDCLLKEANKYKVEIRMKSEVRSLKYENEKFQVIQSDLRPDSYRVLTSDFICIACGGYPKTPMFEWLKQTGHSIEEPVPSLFTFNIQGDPVTRLPGISVANAIVKVAGTKLSAQGPLLITHWGLSGPVILRLSAWGARQLANCNWQYTITINWLPQYHEQSLQEEFYRLRNEIGSQKIINRNPFALPQRLWEYFIEQSVIAVSTRWADLPAKEQNRLIKICCAQEFRIQGKTTYKEEFVTAGGIRLTEIDAQTMQSKICPNLYFAGEIMDVDGITGGFNFQHAWTSGYIAADSIAGMP